jgi:hypothetical protein
MVYTKLFPVSLTYTTNVFPEKFDTNIFNDNFLKCAILELGACKAFMYLKSPGSKCFWLGEKIIDTVEVLIIGWDKDNWLIQYNGEVYRLPFIHFMELKTIKAAPFN